MLTESQNYLEDPAGPFRVAPGAIALFGKELHLDFNGLRDKVDARIKARKLKLSVTGKNQTLNAVSWRNDATPRTSH